MLLILWRSERVLGAMVIFFLLFAAFTLPFVWHSPRLSFWYKEVGPVVGLTITIGALVLALRK